MKVFTAKNSKVYENGNHLDISVHASQLDVGLSFSNEYDHHRQHQTHSKSNKNSEETESRNKYLDKLVPTSTAKSTVG